MTDTSDLVKRLREMSQNLWTTTAQLEANKAAKAAADRLEALEAEVAHLAACKCKNPVNLPDGGWVCVDIEELEAQNKRLRAALEPFSDVVCKRGDGQYTIDRDAVAKGAWIRARTALNEGGE